MGLLIPDSLYGVLLRICGMGRNIECMVSRGAHRGVARDAHRACMGMQVRKLLQGVVSCGKEHKLGGTQCGMDAQ